MVEERIDGPDGGIETGRRLNCGGRGASFDCRLPQKFHGREANP
jgi:hypothetical protein